MEGKASFLISKNNMKKQIRFLISFQRLNSINVLKKVNKTFLSFKEFPFSLVFFYNFPTHILFWKHINKLEMELIKIIFLDRQSSPNIS